MSAQHIITVYKPETVEHPWAPLRVLVDGKPDPRNREFESLRDIHETYALLQANGFYRDYFIDTKTKGPFNTIQL